MIFTTEQQLALRDLALSQASIITDAYKNRSTLETHYKSDGCDFATETDELVEKNLTEGIMKIFPSAIVCGEEFGLSEAIQEDRLVFIIDPIDGTKYFRYGMSLVTLSIGVQYNGKNIW